MTVFTTTIVGSFGVRPHNYLKGGFYKPSYLLKYGSFLDNNPGVKVDFSHMAAGGRSSLISTT